LGEVVDQEERLLFVAQPEVLAIPTGGNGDLEFKVEIELRPELDPIGYLGIDVERPRVEVDGEVVDAELESLREKFSSIEPIEGRDVIEEGDVATVHFEAVDQDDETLQDLRGQDVEVIVGKSQTLPGISEALLGATFEGAPVASVSLPDDFQIEDLAGRTVELRLDIQTVKQRVLPELDDEFAIDTGEAETLEELRQIVEGRVSAAMDKEAANFAKNQLMSLLLEQNDVELPPKFVDEQTVKEVQSRLQSMQYQGLDVQSAGLDLQALRETVKSEKSEQLKSEFLLMAIASKEGLVTTDDDLAAYFEDQASGIGVPREQFEAYIRGDGDRLSQAQGSCLLHKTVDHLLSEATINEIAWDEARERAEKSQLSQEGGEASDAELAEDSNSESGGEVGVDAGGDEESS
jgi:trigger factor